MSGVLRIVKVGGSLFSLPDLAARLRQWLSKQPVGCNVLIAGGGALAEEVRRWDERFQLGQESSHWLCADLLDSTAQLLHHLLPESRLAESVVEGARRTHEIVVLAPSRFLRQEESTFSGERLPHTWGVTTDSIAARVAEVMEADELVLLKSKLPEPLSTVEELSDTYVDERFASVIKGIAGKGASTGGLTSPARRGVANVRFVNLRESDFPEMCLAF